MRLWMSHSCFKRCLKKLRSVLKNEKTILPLMLRLTDQEILLFARSSSSEIQSYIAKASKEQLRWKMLALVYFSEKHSEL